MLSRESVVTRKASLAAALSILHLVSLDAEACSWPPIDPRSAVDIARAELIVLGTLRDAGTAAVTLEVEQYLKGSAGRDALTVNNHSFDVGGACNEIVGPGSRFPNALRVLAFLTRDDPVFGAGWRPMGLGGDGMFAVDGGLLLPADEVVRGRWRGSLEQAKGLVARGSIDDGADRAVQALGPVSEILRVIADRVRAAEVGRKHALAPSGGTRKTESLAWLDTLRDLAPPLLVLALAWGCFRRVLTRRAHRPRT